MWGMDPMEYLTTEDPMKRLAMMAVALKADKLDQELHERRATQIANAVVRAFSG